MKDVEGGSDINELRILAPHTFHINEANITIWKKLNSMAPESRYHESFE
jgi:hypothetical protein